MEIFYLIMKLDGIFKSSNYIKFFTMTKKKLKQTNKPTGITTQRGIIPNVF